MANHSSPTPNSFARFLRDRLLPRLAAAGLSLCVAAAAPASADPWASVGPWKIISLTGSTGCTMGVKYPDGAMLVVSARYAPDGLASWEMLAADAAWQVIEAGKSYPVDIHIVGTDLPPRRQMLHGYRNGPISGLVAAYADFSDFSSFLSNGLANGTAIAFMFDDKLMGMFSLGGAEAAYGELLKCYAEAVVRAQS